MQRTKKILIIAGEMNLGGLENQLVHLAKCADKNLIKIDFTSTCENAYYKDEIIKAGCGFILIPSNEKSGIFKYILNLYRVIKNGEYDVVHSHELFHSGIEMFVSWLCGVPKRIAHSHSTRDIRKENKLSRKIYHRLMRLMIGLFSTNMVGCSSGAAEFLFGKKALKNKKVSVIFNSVETERYFDKKFIEASYDKKDGWKYVAHVGRLVPLKNHDFLLDIAEEFKKQNKKICFVFAGDGELFEKLSEAIKIRELQEYVMLLGARNDVPDVLLYSDAFVLPSLFEGMPLSLIEAQAAGLCCVASDNITKEVDFGLNLVSYLSLNVPLSDWDFEIEKAVNTIKPEESKIKTAILEKGFSVNDFCRKVCELYL